MSAAQAKLLQAILMGSVSRAYDRNYHVRTWKVCFDNKWVLSPPDSMKVYITNAGNDALQAYLSTPVRMMSYCVDINGQWYSDEMPEDEFDEETAVERTVHSRIAGGTYSAHLVYASYEDGTFVNYGGDDER